MFEYLSFFLLVFTSLSGIFFLVKLAGEWLFDEKEEKPALFLLPVKGHEERIELRVRALLSKSEGLVVLVDFGLDKETLTILEKIKEKHSNVVLLQDCELTAYLAKMT